MIVLLAITQGITLILLVAVAAALLAVARQVGVLHERVAPAGALTPRQGPAVGTPAPRIQTTTLDGDAIEIGGALRPGARRLLFFVSAQCPICKKLIPFARSFAKAEGIELVFAGDDDAARQARLVADHGLLGYAFVNDGSLGRAFAVDKLPHAVLLGDDGTLLARGLVNSREHLESMVVSHESGMASVQDYLKARLAKPA
ncbi:methylamine utilization protein MauD [Sphingomonas spermidinifaciens]|uniref:Methylamine utilization protein MauD n=1 Tax=Sphingomonas spermidinifaciens TaxID=1141889 RepID=A0A2A4B374_9SPHN|nr:methylamine utilization protein MauD [Sphingomonas spermidinifaciens]PCD02086.1 methylamine utilization protein MauD [Sphingomonas spermidinifaciens]